MATSFDDDERSVDKSRPIDLYVITTPTVTYRLTSYVVDLTYAGEVYTATTMGRGGQVLAQDLTGREFLVYLPISHPIVQRYAAFGIPQREVLISAYRLQTRSNTAQQFAQGFAQALSVDGGMASLRVPSITDDAMKIRLPTVAAQRLCNHVLFDSQCQVNRAAFGELVTITAISGNTITTTSTVGPPELEFGDVEHQASAERRMVIAQSGQDLILNMPFVEAVVGDTVIVTQGCDHSLQTCRDKFNNVVNFGGLPHMNLLGGIDPWAPGGLGIVVQS